MTTATLRREYTFEAAHRLPYVPEGHKCGNVHGHSYRVTVFVRGPINSMGWVVDFGDVDAVARPVIARLDHTNLNALLPNPTSELLCAWLLRQLRAVPHLYAVSVSETERSMAMVTVDDLDAAAREREALRATLARVEAATASVSSLPWPLPVPAQAEWDAMHPAEKAVRDAVGQWRRLAVERGAEVERLTAGRDATMDALVAGAENVATERDALRSLLGAAARGELPRCSRVEACGRLATREGNWRWSCDEHGEGLADLPHAAALRAAMGGAK